MGGALSAGSTFADHAVPWNQSFPFTDLTDYKSLVLELPINSVRDGNSSAGKGEAGRILARLLSVGEATLRRGAASRKGRVRYDGPHWRQSTTPLQRTTRCDLTIGRV